MGRRRLALIAGLILVIAAPVGAVARSSKAGGPHACNVTNTSSGATYSNKSTTNPVQTAIDAAASGATLEIAGRCIGNFVIQKDITLRGVATKQNPIATLDGNNIRPLTAPGLVLWIPAIVSVTVRDLRITGGSAEPDGGGINNSGSLTLINSIVTANAAFSIPPGQVTRGGGIWNGGTLVLTNSTVSNNSSAGWGGGIYNSGGAVTLTDSVVSGNSGVGGGIFNLFGSVMLSGATMIQGNASGGNGGGILNDSGTVSTSGWTGAVSGNTPDNCEPAMTLGASTCD